jgi:ABC-type multidrug transport system ATPase subunit
MCALVVYGGQVKINGHIVKDGSDVGASFDRISAFVQQEDLMLGTLTVGEHLTFNSHLRLGGMTATKQAEKVDALIADFGLGRCRDTLIGDYRCIFA